MRSENSTILIVPGLRDHVEEHWQTLLAWKLKKVRTVPPLVQDKFSCVARVKAIQQVVEEIDGPIIVVAHSAGVIMFVHWAQTYRRPIKGALLATPPDLEIPLPAGYPTPETLQINRWFPVPSKPLPFPSIVAASENDHLATYSSVESMAKAWGSELFNLGKVGHLNPSSGYGEWPRALEVIDRIEEGFIGVADRT